MINQIINVLCIKSWFTALSRQNCTI